MYTFWWEKLSLKACASISPNYKEQLICFISTYNILKNRKGPIDNMGTIVHTWIMKKIRRSSVYLKWIKKLKDRTGKALIYERIRRLAFGNPGDVEPAGEGISELRIHYGPGYRVYFKALVSKIKVEKKRLLM